MSCEVFPRGPVRLVLVMIGAETVETAAPTFRQRTLEYWQESVNPGRTRFRFLALNARPDANPNPNPIARPDASLIWTRQFSCHSSQWPLPIQFPNGRHKGLLLSRKQTHFRRIQFLGDQHFDRCSGKKFRIKLPCESGCHFAISGGGVFEAALAQNCHTSLRGVCK